jgi:hypothetical protein
MTSAPIFAVQYLESPYPEATPAAARIRLRQACERLPISLVLLGWDLSPAVEEAVAVETTRQHAKLFRWQPLLTRVAHADFLSDCAPLGAAGNPIPGFGGKPEFQFICPNCGGVAEILLERMESVSASGMFQGLFLDRIRFPSPSKDPLRELACFCTHCTHLAADIGLDLGIVRKNIQFLPAATILRSLLGKADDADSPLEVFLDFRASSISRIVRMVSKQAHSLNLSVGLDCFSPALARMVGQDLSTLAGFADWVKIMTYPRVFGPAGIPFELQNLVEWLSRIELDEYQVMDIIGQASGLTLPANKEEMRLAGLGSETISKEIQRASELGIAHLLAGIAMVNVERIHEYSTSQIQTDLAACRNADGLVISWDLWLTPLEYLDIIRTIWS